MELSSCFRRSRTRDRGRREPGDAVLALMVEMAVEMQFGVGKTDPMKLEESRVRLDAGLYRQIIDGAPEPRLTR